MNARAGGPVDPSFQRVRCVGQRNSGSRGKAEPSVLVKLSASDREVAQEARRNAPVVGHPVVGRVVTGEPPIPEGQGQAEKSAGAGVAEVIRPVVKERDVVVGAEVLVDSICERAVIHGKSRDSLMSTGYCWPEAGILPFAAIDRSRFEACESARRKESSRCDHLFDTPRHLEEAPLPSLPSARVTSWSVVRGAFYHWDARVRKRAPQASTCHRVYVGCRNRQVWVNFAFPQSQTN